jgi:hypothetical protein
MKKFFVLIISGIFLSIQTIGTSASLIEDEQYQISHQWQTPGYHQIIFQESLAQSDAYPHLFAEFYPNSSTFSRYICTNMTSEHCSGADQYNFTSIFPKCESISDTDCVESLSSTANSGSVDEGIFKSYTQPKHENLFSVPESTGIPHTQTPSIWNLAATPHSAGTQYALAVGIEGKYSAAFPERNSQQLFAYLLPVSAVKAGAGDTGIDQTFGYMACHQNPNPPQGIPNTWCMENTMYQTVNCQLDIAPVGNCLQQHTFPSGFRFKVSLRVKSEPTSWLHGRMVDPNISIAQIPSGGAKIVVDAQPTKIPVIYQEANWSDTPKSVRDFWDLCRKDSSCKASGLTYLHQGDPEDQQNSVAAMPSFGSIALKGVQTIAPLVGDKSVAIPSAWNFHTLPTDQLTQANSCFKNGPGLKGIVTTNSTAYSEGPPAFKDGSLQYTVASPHFNPDGSVFKGSYNLVVKSDVARCLYKFTNAPIKASISVISSDGSADVATTVSNETGGWLYLSANNFTFSTPTVQVKLSQDAPTPVVAPTPIATPKPDPSASSTPVAAPAPAPIVVPVVAAKKTSITCVKGKITKSVTAVKPVCPTGYKRK